jgi:hypothetical protein
MIVKVQFPLLTNEAAQCAMVYNKSRSWQELIAIEDLPKNVVDTVRQKEHLKCFFDATLSKDGLLFQGEAPDPGW